MNNKKSKGRWCVVAGGNFPVISLDPSWTDRQTPPEQIAASFYKNHPNCQEKEIAVTWREWGNTATYRIRRCRAGEPQPRQAA